MDDFDGLIINAHIATMATGATPYGMIENGAVGMRRGRIAWVGPMAELPVKDVPDFAVNAHGACLTPGLIDAHTHLIFAGNRAREFEMRLEGASYEEIARAGGGILATVNATRAATVDELVHEGRNRLRPLMDEGVTTVEIKSGYGLDMASEHAMLQAARQLGRMTDVDVVATCLAAHAVPPEFEGDADGYIDWIVEDLLPALVADDLVDAVDAFLENIAFTGDQVRRVLRAAERLDLPVKLHGDQLSDGGSAALAAEFGALSVDHLEYTDTKGVNALARAGTVAMLLPGAFYYLKETQKPPVAQLRAAGVPMALATDCNPGSSPIMSILTIMNMGATLFDLTPEECLRGVTANAAKALGLSADRGTIEKGKRADLALYDIAQPAELTYWVGRNPRIATWKDGVAL